MVRHKTPVFLSLLFGLLSIGWVDPLADKVKDGNQLYHNGKYDEAMDKYVNAQIDLPDNPQLDFNIGDAQYKRGKYNEATRSFEKVIKSEDSRLRAKSNFNMGNTLYRQGKMQEALECYKKAVDFIEETESPNDSELDTLKNDAKYNYEFVQKKVNEEKQKQQNQDQKNQDQKDQQQKKEEQNTEDKQPDENKDKDGEKQRQQENENGEDKDETQPKPEDNQKKEEKRDERRSQSQQDKQKNQPLEQQQKSQAQEQKQMSKEEAERFLDALNQSEKEARMQKRDTQRSAHRSVEKDW